MYGEINRRQEAFRKKEVSEVQFLEALRVLNTVSFEDPEANMLIQTWSQQEYRRVPNNPRAMIEFNLRTARLYLRAGHGEGSYEMFCDARDQAINEGNSDLAVRIDNEINDILARQNPEQG
jgi:hypothetical protein